MFFFGWKRLTKVQHLVVTWLVALGSNFSALWILVANAWMQNPVGAAFNPQTMRMELTSFTEVLFNPVAQSKFVHTVSAGYVTGAMFVMSISAYYILRRRHVDIARRSLTVAASFGLASALSVVVLGDESGYTAGENQKMKIAAIEAMWETEPPPASFTLFGIPDLASETTKDEIKIPYALGLIATRSLDKPVEGVKPLVERAEARIRNGMAGYQWLAKEGGRANAVVPAELESSMRDVGYSLLLKRIRPDIENATDGQIHEAALSTIPDVPVLFWSFRIMVALGFYFIALFAVAFYLSSRRRCGRPWFLRTGDVEPAAAVGRRRTRLDRRRIWPPAMDHRRRHADLPWRLRRSGVAMSRRALRPSSLFYSALAVVDVALIVKYVRIGPQSEAEPPPGAPVLPAPAPAQTS